MPTLGMQIKDQALWPQRTPEELKERIIGEVYGNIRIEHPEITREMVAQRVALRQQVGSEVTSAK